jgi:predicted Zn-dependent protease
LAAGLAAIALAGAASAQSTQPKLQLGKYESALKLMDQGQCDKARDMLFPAGKMAPGDEVAISDIGDCYLGAAKKMQDQAEAQKTLELGAGWILRAADIGIREAQATAVRLYLENKVFFPDPYEAGKWYLIWQNNRSQMQLGQVEFDPILSKQLTSYGSDVWAEAKARAAAWRPSTLKSESAASAP